MEPMRRRPPPALRRYAMYRRVVRSADAYVDAEISRLLPGEDGIPLPGVWGFVGCVFRQLYPWPRRRPHSGA
ncbi:MAG TPA: hypothetical protein VFA75_08670 [Nevskia sp.]|nr:hypothetical protein [Nevskia sp.]